jgi:hypothetical protein
MPIQRHVWMAIRKTEGREWFDTTTLGFEQGESQEFAEKFNATMPDWAAVNPVLRVVKVLIQEIEN